MRIKKDDCFNLIILSLSLIFMFYKICYMIQYHHSLYEIQLHKSSEFTDSFTISSYYTFKAIGIDYIFFQALYNSYNERYSSYILSDSTVLGLFNEVVFQGCDGDWAGKHT